MVLLPGRSWREQLVGAKIVLAYADTPDSDGQYAWRDEVGPVLLAELAKLVAAIHEARSTVVAPAASTG
ncbi:hypothetical protein D3C86_1867570 [compost metagenome]